MFYYVHHHEATLQTNYSERQIYHESRRKQTCAEDGTLHSSASMGTERGCGRYPRRRRKSAYAVKHVRPRCRT
nr:MAG TPA: hypothetical protein [Caudoviricetes sp.]